MVFHSYVKLPEGQDLYITTSPVASGHHWAPYPCSASSTKGTPADVVQPELLQWQPWSFSVFMSKLPGPRPPQKTHQATPLLLGWLGSRHGPWRTSPWCLTAQSLAANKTAQSSSSIFIFMSLSSSDWSNSGIASCSLPSSSSESPSSLDSSCFSSWPMTSGLDLSSNSPFWLSMETFILSMASSKVANPVCLSRQTQVSTNWGWATKLILTSHSSLLALNPSCKAAWQPWKQISKTFCGHPKLKRLPTCTKPLTTEATHNHTFTIKISMA